MLSKGSLPKRVGAAVAAATATVGAAVHSHLANMPTPSPLPGKLSGHVAPVNHETFSTWKKDALFDGFVSEGEAVDVIEAIDRGRVGKDEHAAIKGLANIAAAGRASPHAARRIDAFVHGSQPALLPEHTAPGHARVEWETGGAELMLRGKPHSTDIVQGTVGDCWFLATLGATANWSHGGDLLRRRVKANADGTYTVKLFDPSMERIVLVRVDGRLPMPEKATELYQSGAIALWPALYEKALAKLRGGYANIHGGWPGEAFALLTGNPGRDVRSADLDIIREALVRKDAVVASSRSGPRSHGIMARHAYAVDGTYQEKGKEMILLINPHGDWESIPTEAFVENFDAVTIANPR